MTPVLPPDPFWPIRVVVSEDGGQIPFELWFWYHLQFMVPRTELVA